jgi:glucose dehydrogenase
MRDIAGRRGRSHVRPDNGVFALDAQSGALIWHYVPKVGAARYVFRVNRGVAVDSGRVYFNTLDDQLIALDARTGSRLWQTRIGDPRQNLSEDSAPLAWAGLVFVGSSGGEFGVRGSLSAYSQTDGRPVWRWWTVSPGWEGAFRNVVHGYPLHRDIARERSLVPRFRNSWKTGGGPIWMTPALSAADATIYLSTGNPAPDHNGEQRPGDNLFTDSIVALDARTGKMKWYYQETPHDVWDYDAASPPVLVDARNARGAAVAEAEKTGWLYVVERETGKLLRISEPFVPQPHIYEPPTAQGAKIEPGDAGGAIGPIAYDPQARAAYVAGNIDPEIGQTFAVPPWSAAS